MMLFMNLTTFFTIQKLPFCRLTLYLNVALLQKKCLALLYIIDILVCLSITSILTNQFPYIFFGLAF